MAPLFALDNAEVRYGAMAALTLGRWTLEPGQLVSVTGPNGAGKSTLLALLAGMRAYSGVCRYQDREIRSWRPRELARTVSFLPQHIDIPFPFTAEEVVLTGRAPHSAGLFDSPEDIESARRALEQTDALNFRKRDFRTLSGGEKQRVLLAAALAQEPRVLLLDEPTTFLDLKHQVAMYQLLRDLACGGLLVVAVTHDLNLACHYAHHAAVLSRGRLHAEGAPAEVITPALLRDVFEADAPWIGGGR